MPLMIKYQVFVNEYLPVQTQRKINISKRYWICSNLLIKILKQCHWLNSCEQQFSFPDFGKKHP